jgi:ABC-type multidrug transport system fused ATPase/permease subunit
MLIFDEATSAVDSETERIITDIWDELAKDRISIIVSHRLSTLINADWIAVLKDGSVKACGTHDALSKSCPYYARLFQLPVGDDWESAADENIR